MTTTTVIATPSIRFVKGEKPELVKAGELEYQAGKLSFAGQESWPGVIYSVRRYLKNEWGYTAETQQEASPDAIGAANVLLKDKTIVVLTCDYSLTLTPAEVLEWPESFLDECYTAATELNPKLKWEDNQPGQAQPDTHNADGTPKAPEETPKN